MEVGTVLKVVRDGVNKLEQMSLLNNDGTFNTPSAQQDSELALYVEQQLQKYGVAIPDKVVRVTEILPLILNMIK